jgi:hypothetical protein
VASLVTRTETTETVPSLVASTDPSTTGTLQAQVTETTTLMAITSIALPSERQGQAAATATAFESQSANLPTEQTQTASPLGFTFLARQLRVRGGHFSVFAHSTFLSTRLDCFRSTYKPLDFGSWCQRGERERVCRLRGSAWEVFFFVCVILHMHSRLLSCIALHDMWLCWLVCSLLWYILCHVTCLLICFASAFTLFQMSFTLCTYAYSISYEYMSFGLEHIRNLTLLFLLQLLMWTKHIRNLTLFHLLEVLSSITKRGRL